MAGAPIRRARKNSGTEVTAFVPEFEGQQFKGQRPPFAKGNMLHLSHGAHSERVLAPIAAKWVETALTQCEYLRDPSYEPSLLAWARFEAKCDLLHQYIDDNGMFTDTGELTAAAKLLPSYEGRAAKLRSTLGMDPLSRSKLQKNTASTQVDLSVVLAKLEAERKELKP